MKRSDSYEKRRSTMRAGIVATEHVSRHHPEGHPLEDDLQTKVHEDAGHKEQLGDEDGGDLDGRVEEAEQEHQQGHDERQTGS